MSALYVLLSFLAAVAAVAAGYRVWEKRSTTPSSGAIAPTESAKALPVETPTSKAVPTEALLSSPEAAPAIAQAESSSQAPALIASEPKAKMFVSPPIPDPWLEEPPEAEAEPAIPASSVEPVTSASEPVTASPLSPEPANSSGLAISTVEADLSEKILRLGKSGQINQVAYLTRYANHTDSQVRSAVAKALGNLAINWRGTVVESMIPVLGRLSQDSKPEVRLAAVESLGNIQSNKVLPWLQRAQKYADGAVRKAATTALQRLKLNYYPKSALTPKPKVEKAPGKKRL
jgi:hypothetical protein